MTALVGLDLAWTTYRESGICVLRERQCDVTLELLEARIVAPGPLVAWLESLSDTVVAAVDAPLIRRDACTAERDLGRSFGRYKASAYNANTAFLERHNLMAGPTLGAHLASRGWSLNPADAGLVGRRVAFEMYPHAFHVTAFELEERVPYKKGPLASRRGALQVYQTHLAALLAREAPSVASDARLDAVLDPVATAARGRPLKHLEDQLDALTCALSALIAWREGLHPADIFGDTLTGYIAVPGLHRDPRFARA